MSEAACHLELAPKVDTPVQQSKPKPCCVCKDEKSIRDECLLLNGQESGKCDSLIGQYKSCMAGFGFTI